MDLFRPYSASISTMGKERLLLNTGIRHHASLAQIESRSMSLEKSHGVSFSYAEERRYILAKNITFDLFVSIYDVNSRSGIALRLSKPADKKEFSLITKRIRRIKDANIELRAIGLQNGWRGYAKSVNDIYGVSSSHLMEIDLFGTDKRHIALDLKTGTSYDLFLENRIYRPGELANSEKEEDFQRSVPPLSLV